MMATDPLQQAGAAAQESIAIDDFAELIQRDFKPKNEEGKSKIQAAVATLAQQALQDATRIGDDVFSTVDSMVAEIDRKLSEQVNAILHHKEFQDLESAWRGLDYLVTGSETGQDPRDEHQPRRAGHGIQAVPRRGLGPEPAVQEDLRERIRPAWR
jgi:type VI secretion system protein ImpC